MALAAGMTLLGEVGLGPVEAGYEAAWMAARARRFGIRSTIHTGAPSVPRSGMRPLGVLRVIAMLSSLGNMPAARRVPEAADG